VLINSVDWALCSISFRVRTLAELGIGFWREEVGGTDEAVLFM
jgi:hypothetical protein